MEDDDEEDEFVKALLEELSVMRTAVSSFARFSSSPADEVTRQLYQAEMQIVLVESQTKSRVAQEYDAKLLAMERHFQECSREQVSPLLPHRLSNADARRRRAKRKSSSTPSSTSSPAYTRLARSLRRRRRCTMIRTRSRRAKGRRARRRSSGCCLRRRRGVRSSRGL